MIQFWRRLSDQMTHHQVGRITVDRSFVSEPIYPAMTRHKSAAGGLGHVSGMTKRLEPS